MYRKIILLTYRFLKHFRNAVFIVKRLQRHLGEQSYNNRRWLWKPLISAPNSTALIQQMAARVLNKMFIYTLKLSSVSGTHLRNSTKDVLVVWVDDLALLYNLIRICLSNGVNSCCTSYQLMASNQHEYIISTVYNGIIMKPR